MGKLTSKLSLVILAVSFLSFSCQKKSNETRMNISNSMKETKQYTILKEVSVTSIGLAKDDFNEFEKKSQWLGYSPATDFQIKELETKLGLNLPDDYKEFLVLSNGFKATSSVEPHFMNTSQVNFLQILDNY